jgi:hypothetical protein
MYRIVLIREKFSFGTHVKPQKGQENQSKEKPNALLKHARYT